MMADRTRSHTRPPEPSFDPATHRKRVRHYDEPGHAHELTFSCYQGSPLLSEQMYCVLLSQSIDRAIKKQGFELIAFVYMPEHVHMIVLPATLEARVARLLFGIKRPFSTRAKQLMLQTDELMVRRLTIRERPGGMLGAGEHDLPLSMSALRPDMPPPTDLP